MQDPVHELLEDFRRTVTCDIDFRQALRNAARLMRGDGSCAHLSKEHHLCSKPQEPDCGGGGRAPGHKKGLGIW
jgi:hypothetical protein